MGGLTSKKKREESGSQEQPSLLDQLSDGTVVILTSKASGKSLRIHEDTVDGLGEEGEDSQFQVHKKDSESGLVLTLQNVANKEKWVQIKEGQLLADGTGDELSELSVTETNGCVVLESAKTPGQYVAVQEDGSGQVATELGPTAHFTPLVKTS